MPLASKKRKPAPKNSNANSCMPEPYEVPTKLFNVVKAFVVTNRSTQEKYFCFVRGNVTQFLNGAGKDWEFFDVINIEVPECFLF